MARTIQDLMDLTPADLSRMNEAALRDITQQMASAANKRLKRLKTEGLERISPAARSALKRGGVGTRAGGVFSVRVEPKEGDTKRNALLHEFSDARRFMSYKTSTVKGTKNMMKSKSKMLDDENPFNIPTAKKTKSGKIKPPSKRKIQEAVEKENEFWELYEKAEEVYPTLFIKNPSGPYVKSLYAVKEKKNPYEVKKLLAEITKHNVSQKRKNIDAYADQLADSYYYLNEKHRRVKFAIEDDDDILQLFTMAINAKYETLQDQREKELEGNYVEL